MPVVLRPGDGPAQPAADYAFRLLLIAYFAALYLERGIAWRAAASLAMRSLGLGLDAAGSARPRFRARGG